MHSTGIISRWRQRIARPPNSAGTSVAEMTWLGTTSASCPNHHSDSRVRIVPLSGTGVGSTTSYTDTRSEATSTISSPSPYTSRTLPECSSSTALRYRYPVHGGGTRGQLRCLVHPGGRHGVHHLRDRARVGRAD